MAREIERKFVFVGNLRDLQNAGMISEIRSIRQGYYSGPKDSMVVRVRQQEVNHAHYFQKSSFLTIKRSDGGPGMIEHEIQIGNDQATEMLGECGDKLITKHRYIVPLLDGLKAEIDYFNGGLSGIQIVEIEIPSENYVFTVPDFCGVELTDVPGISNFNMALNPDKAKDILSEYFKC